MALCITLTQAKQKREAKNELWGTGSVYMEKMDEANKTLPVQAEPFPAAQAEINYAGEAGIPETLKFPEMPTS